MHISGWIYHHIRILRLLPFRGVGLRGLAESYDHEKCKNNINNGFVSKSIKFSNAFGAFLISSMNEDNTNKGNNNKDN